MQPAEHKNHGRHPAPSLRCLKEGRKRRKGGRGGRRKEELKSGGKEIESEDKKKKREGNKVGEGTERGVCSEEGKMVGMEGKRQLGEPPFHSCLRQVSQPCRYHRCQTVSGS